MVYTASKSLANFCENLQAEDAHMNSKRELRDQPTDQNLSSSQRAQLRCQLARPFEDQGDHEAARVAMGDNEPQLHCTYGNLYFARWIGNWFCNVRFFVPADS